MKYMISMFGSAAEMMETQSKEWITEMIDFMTKLDDRLRANGELIDAQGLSDADQARVVRLVDGAAVVTDGPFAETKESLVGYWVVDVASEERLLELCGEIIPWSGLVEVRPIPAGPPDVHA